MRFSFAVLLVGAVAGDSDVGYDWLFTSAPEEFDQHCVKVSKAFPEWAAGDFIITSIGLLEMNDRKFVGVLDAFGKIHRFAMRGDTVCATYRLMGTGFYNESKKANTIGPGLLFAETDPPRHCPLYNPLCNQMAPNDNTFVLTIKVGSELVSTTDAPIMVAIDPKTLNVTERIMVGQADAWKGHIRYLGSAHPVVNPNTQEWVDFVGGPDIGMKASGTVIQAYSFTDNVKESKTVTDVSMETPPYMHSFGITGQHLVFPHMPVKFVASKMFYRPMGDAYEDVEVNSDTDPNNAFYVAPLNGSKPWVRYLPKSHKLYYVHTLNAYENETGIVLDISTLDGNPFKGSYDSIPQQLDKATRDSDTAGRHIRVERFLLPFADVPVTTELLSDPRVKTEFMKINPLFAAKKHCFYWANTWFDDLKSYASMSVVKYDVCGGQIGKTGIAKKQLKWRREFWYPSEPMMIPSTAAGAKEDEGIVVFTALDGAQGQTRLVALDARTMEVLSEAGPFPHIPYTAHGAFYPEKSFEASRSEGIAAFV